MNSLAKTLLGGSGLVALVVVSCVSGCSSTASDGGAAGSGGSGMAGTSSEAGASEGGTTTNGGTSATSGAAGASETGSGGAADEPALGTAGEAGAPTAASGAVAKFCNRVAFGAENAPMDITLRIDIGTAPDIVSISALTGTCVPITGAACKSIPLGAEVPVALIDPSTDDQLDSAMLPVVDGKEYIFWADAVDVGGGQMAPIIQGGSIAAGGPTCSEFDVGDLP